MLSGTVELFAQNPAGKQFPAGAVRALEDVPASRLRDRIARLPAQARDRAVAWLGNVHFTEGDLATLRVDANGGIYFADPIAPALDVANVQSEPPLAQAAVAISPFPAHLIFHSKRGAPNVLYLNFCGENVSNTAWNDDVERTTIPAIAFSTDSDLTTFSDSEQEAIRRIWQRVAEDYAPFNIDVTTERPATFTVRTAHALITRHTDANGAENPASFSGGVAYVGVFANASFAKYRPAWIYQDNLGGEESYIAEAVSHEVGHNLGLTHDGKTDGADYYGGHGSGETSWGPIMGTAYNRNVSQWSRGEYYLANNTQDDLATIAGKISYRSDDHGNTLSAATALSVGANGSITSTTPETDPANTNQVNKGVVERNTDVDFFSFATASGNVSFSVKPWIVPDAITRGGNVDLVIQLYNAAGQLLFTNNAAAATGATIQTNLAEGVYYVSIKSSGVGSPTSSTPSGYASYASMGQYFISGSIVPSGVVIPPGAVLAITDITEPGLSAKSFTVTYSDDVGIDVTSIGNDDIRVTGPNGYSTVATLLSVDFPSNGSPRTATYKIDPPNGAWTDLDDGLYTVSVLTNGVKDVQGSSVPAASLGAFTVAVPRAIYFASMAANPGWSMNGLWQFGAPAYTSGGPTAGFSGSNIIAYNLSGNYENRLSPVYATTPPINCSGASTLTLRFQRWLRVRNGDTANIQISTNGTTWIDLWSNIRVVSDNAWQSVQYSLPSWAAGSPSLQIRWGMASGQSQNDIGWNIDDVALLGNGSVDTTPPVATLSAGNLTTGGSPTHTFTVTYTDDTAVSVASFGATDLVVVGPNGTNTVDFAGADVASDGTPRSAVYSLSAPNGLWTSADNGAYNIYLQESEITDTASNSAEPALLGAITVAISTNKQAMVVDLRQLAIVEGAQTNISVRLAEQPSANVVVVARATGDGDIAIVSGATNIFTPQNWDRPVQITITASQDGDRENGTATIICESDSLASVDVTIAELDTTQSPPSITLTAPANSSVFLSTDVITFSATASDDSAVSTVEFFANGNSIGSDTTAPYAVTGTLPPGGYAITAKATDDAGLTSISVPIQIEVEAVANPPEVSGISVSSGIATVHATTSSGFAHVLEVTSDFQNWAPVATNTPISGTVTFYFPISGSRQVFRVVVERP